MGLLEYATQTVPDVVDKSVLAFFNRDPLLRRLQASGNVKRNGGEKVRIIRIKSGHSDVVQIDESNMSIPLNKRETLDLLEGDWARFIKPLVIPHFDKNRMPSKADKKAYVQKMVKAAMMSLKNDFQRRMYVGLITKLRGFATMNGSVTNGTSLGFENGALQFVTPASQTGTYLGETRSIDTTNEVDHWYNQFVAMTTGIGTDALPTIEEIKTTADSFAEEEGSGITIGLLGIQDHVALADEVRGYPGGGAATLTTTIAEIESGKAHPMVHHAAGILFYSNRWINPGGTVNMQGSGSEHIYLVNPDTMEWWVNAGEDFRTTEFTDHLKTSNQDADIAYIICEVQDAMPNLMCNGCTFLAD